jgi:hypothetical protein
MRLDQESLMFNRRHLKKHITKRSLRARVKMDFWLLNSKRTTMRSLKNFYQNWKGLRHTVPDSTEFNGSSSSTISTSKGAAVSRP